MKYLLTILFFLFIIQIANAEENLVGYWKFEYVNLTNYTTDSSVYGNDGKLINFSTNPPSTVVGRIGQALQFDGVKNYVDVGNSSILNFGTGGFSIEAWIKTGSTSETVPIIRKDTNKGGPRWAVSLNSSGFVSAYIGDESANRIVNSSISVNDNIWHYISIVFSRNQNASVFVDGRQSGNSIDISSLGSISNTENLLIGREGTNNIFFNGTIDEVKIWNKSLTSLEIFENYFGRRTNPIVIPDISEVSGNTGMNYTFNITVTNMDNQSYSNSIFKLISDCPTNWNCVINPVNQTIPPGNSSSFNLTISPFIVFSEKTLINTTVINMNDTRYNTTIGVGFILGSKCDKANIRITDVYFYANTSANITVENNGTSGLKIKSAIITDKSGKTYNADKLPANFDAGKKGSIIFTNISTCENFSKVAVTTDCPTVSATYTEARCSIKTQAIVKIKSVKYEDDIVKIELRNDGNGVINSSLIKLLIDGRNVTCKQKFQLPPKNIEECDITDFVCSKTTAELKITDPNSDEKEFECLKQIIITVKTCIDALCNEPSETFMQGKKIYMNIDTQPEADVTAVMYLNGGKQTIDITQPFKPKEAGNYTIELTASREGYKDTVSKIEFTVIESGGFPIKIAIILLGIVILAGFIVFYRNYKKNKDFEKLYKKYGSRG